MTKMTKNDQR